MSGESIKNILGLNESGAAPENTAVENRVAVESVPEVPVIKSAAEVLSSLKITPTAPLEENAKEKVGDYENSLDALMLKGNVAAIPRSDAPLRTVTEEERAKLIEVENTQAMQGTPEGVAPIRESSMISKEEIKKELSEEDLLSELDRVKQKGEGDRSELLLDQESRKAIIADFDKTFKSYAQEYGEAVRNMYEAGILDEEGNEIPPENREAVLAARRAKVEAGEKVEAFKEYANITKDDETIPEKPSVVKTEIRKKGVLDPASLTKLESIKKRKKQGYNVSGFLPNSCLPIRAYPMDTAFKKQDLQESLMYTYNTYFYNKKIMRMIFDHTSILAVDGDKVTFEKFMEIIHLDDLDDLFMMHILAGLKKKKLPGWEVSCDSKEEGACKTTQEKIDLDVKDLYNRACYESEAYMERFKYSLDRTKTVTECVAISKIDESHSVEYTDKGDIIKVTFSRPNLVKYFDRLAKIKAGIVNMMLMDEMVYNTIDAMQDWNARPIEDQVLVLSYKFKALYEKCTLKLQRFIYIDKIEIYPEGYKTDLETTPEEAGVMTIDVDTDPVELLVEFIYDMPTESSRTIGNKVLEISDSIKRSYKFDHTCSACGKVTTHVDEFDPKDLFSYWIGSDSE